MDSYWIYVNSFSLVLNEGRKPRGDKNREKDTKNVGCRWCQNELLHYEFGLGVNTMPNGKSDHFVPTAHSTIIVL